MKFKAFEIILKIGDIQDNELHVTIQKTGKK